MGVTMTGVDELHERLVQLERRCEAPIPHIAPRLFSMYEQQETKLWDKFTEPTYVRTGDTKRSMTRGGKGAVRQAGPNELEFGTSIWYAVFLKKDPPSPIVGHASGVRMHIRGKRRSAIVFSSYYARKLAAVAIRDYIASRGPEVTSAQRYLRGIG